METVAVFFEKPVRTYGLMVREGHLVLNLECTAGQLAGLTAALSALEPPLRLISCSLLWEEELACLQVCLPGDQVPRLEQAAVHAGARLAGRGQASVVNLQGPHFGDRWGLASEALDGLGEAGVEPLCFLGVTHTLQLALAPDDSQAALEGLGERFTAPGGVNG
ncbi:MAG: hypothetical protein KJ720_00175 [Proteobacteria bacterium]|nr:hypothetical protein [Pseudomonadota bacterium]MBU1451407.1 hypothetical protein [Pseudomonadota bacterium]MBU2468104.1 hypothetical protein [Pseudomonadota bacterium]MBU2516348.1 hypothetical protein [Pseudomonadota bacterium]